MPLLIFDFDGVIADSELIANETLAAGLSEIGLPTTPLQSIERYMGRRWADCVQQIEEALGGPLPEGFVAHRRAMTRARVEQELQAVRGAHDFLARHAHLPRCIASSSTFDWLDLCLKRFNLADDFAGRLFSGTQVTHGKPAPDLFLLAAHTMGHAPSETWVIEDSPAGVTAGVAAGMTVIGLTAGSHTHDGHAEKLLAAGAHHIAADFEEIDALVQR